MIFGDDQSNSVIQIYPGLSLVAMATKFGTAIDVSVCDVGSRNDSCALVLLYHTCCAETN